MIGTGMVSSVKDHLRPEDETAYDQEGNRSRRSRILDVEWKEQREEIEGYLEES